MYLCGCCVCVDLCVLCDLFCVFVFSCVGLLLRGGGGRSSPMEGEFPMNSPWKHQVFVHSLPTKGPYMRKWLLEEFSHAALLFLQIKGAARPDPIETDPKGLDHMEPKEHHREAASATVRSMSASVIASPLKRPTVRKPWPNHGKPACGGLQREFISSPFAASLRIPKGLMVTPPWLINRGVPF